LEQVTENRVQVLDEARHIEIEPGNTVISLVRGCVTYRISADEIILATGYKKSDRLFQNLRRRLNREIVYAAGDCADPRDIHWAIREGHEVGLRV
jgi:thioredoxin reductase